MATTSKGRGAKAPAKAARKAATKAKAKAKPTAKAKAKAKPARKPATKARPAAAPPVMARRARHAQLRLSAEHVDPSLFAPFTEGERAHTLRVLLEDERLRELGKIGRYRVITVEPLVMKPPEPFAGRRCARVIIFDYATGQTLDASVDLDACVVFILNHPPGQPFLALEEEAAARRIAAADPRVAQLAGAGATAQAVMHYWSRRPAEAAYHRRTAAVLVGVAGARPTLVALVDLLNAHVTDVVPAGQW